VAYASYRAGKGNRDIWVREIGGGNPVRLTFGEAEEYEPAFSPDNKQIAFRSDGDEEGIYVVPAIGGRPRLLGKDGRYPRFSPDGRCVAYTVGSFMRESRIYLVAATGGEPRRLEINVPFAAWPIWSPDSKYLLFTGNTDATNLAWSTRDWYVVPVKGINAVKTGVHRVFAMRGLQAGWLQPYSWLDENRIVFGATLGDRNNLWRAQLSPAPWRIDGNPERLTTGLDEQQASISHVGRIVYSSGAVISNIWSLPIDANQGKVTGELRRVTSGTVQDDYPTISADGTKLAFTSNRSGSKDAWLLDIPTGQLSQLTDTPVEEYRAVIAPDGSNVAIGRLEGRRTHIHILTLEGGVEKRLVEEGAVMSWSSDSTKVVYLEGRPPRHFAIDVNSGESWEVASHPELPLYTGKYAPDDRWFSFRLGLTSFRDPVFIAPLRNGVAAGQDEWIQATEASDLVGRNWWSPDGSLVYFLSLRDGNDCLWARRLDPVTKKPLGDLLDVWHLHGPRRVMNTGTVGFGLSRDKWYFTMHEQIRNVIWLAEPQARD